MDCLICLKRFLPKSIIEAFNNQRKPAKFKRRDL